jgi:hypothetical protein
MPRGRRRSLKHALFKPTPVLDQNDRFALKRCAEYLVRLLSFYPLTDPHTLALVQWVVKEDIQELGQFLLDHLVGSPRDWLIEKLDEADNLLNTEYSWFRRGETQDKGWLNQLLEVPGLRMIWITNDIGSIEESVLRRFAYSLPFKPFNRRQRLQLWENVLKGQQAKSRLDGPEVLALALAKKYRVSAGGVELVVRKALEAGRTEKKAFHRAVELGLNAHQTLLNG